jgi:adenylate kinase family enzyme
MESTNFPIFKTKIEGLNQKFDLNSVSGRQAYFQAKVGPEIAKIKQYLESDTFVAFLLGKKNSGKGTYSKMFKESVSQEKVGHLSVGDIVRDIHEALETTPEAKANLIKFLEDNYRGFHSVEETLDLISGRNQSTLISSELILALMKYEISKRSKQALFIDGFPRALDQISYSLFLKEIIGYKDTPDFLVFINVPNSVIDERIKYRVICPVCKVPRNRKLLATNKAGYDEKTGEFYLICDEHNERMVPKEGDSLGIEPIRKRLEVDNQIFNQLLKLTGIPKVYLRNSLPKDVALDYVDDYEITPEYYYERDSKSGEVKILQKPWTVKDDEGVESYSLMPTAVEVALIKQIAQVLGL